MRYTGPKRRLSRREGTALFPKDVRFIERKGAVPPGVRGTKIRPRFSEFNAQLREKQKTKRLYGLAERQFRNLFWDASKSKGATGQRLLEFLETRLDNIVYRLGFAKSRPEARQIVVHGHILVDGKKTTIPSYRVKINSLVEISSNFLDNTQVQKNLKDDIKLPGWILRKASIGKVLRLPTRDEMENIINEQLIVEYYSR